MCDLLSFDVLGEYQLILTILMFTSTRVGDHWGVVPIATQVR
jgi:hypothetical protein